MVPQSLNPYMYYSHLEAHEESLLSTETCIQKREKISKIVFLNHSNDFFSQHVAFKIFKHQIYIN